MDAFVHEGEFGVSVGAAHYLGDLTAGMKAFNTKPKFAGGIFLENSLIIMLA